MTPVDSFLHSVRGAFAPSTDSAWIWALVALGLALAVGLGVWRARRLRGRAAEAAFVAFVTGQRLSGEQSRLLTRLAARAGAVPLDVATSLDLFERATALELAGEKPSVSSGTESGAGADLFGRVHELRRSLGFHVVPDHLALLTTRELVPGTHVAVAAVGGEVIEVNEAWFAVIAAPDTTFAAAAANATVRLTFTRDARYVARCPVLAAEPPPAPRKLLFRHDEKPERHQLRAAVRVSAHGAVRLAFRPAGIADDEGAAELHTVAAELLDISVGGMAVTAPRALRLGTALHATITWDGEIYGGLPATVLRCDEKLGGRFLVRLEFHALPATEEGRLAAAIARHSARPEDKAPVTGG